MFNVGKKVQILEGIHKGSVGKVTSHLPFMRYPLLMSILEVKDPHHYTVLLNNGMGSVVGLNDLQMREVK